MEAFTELEALTAVMDRINVDTDQIIPKQFLKKIERTGFGKHLFHDWRYLNDEGTSPTRTLSSMSHAIREQKSCWHETTLAADPAVNMRHGPCWTMDSAASLVRVSLISSSTIAGRTGFCWWC